MCIIAYSACPAIRKRNSQMKWWGLGCKNLQKCSISALVGRITNSSFTLLWNFKKMSFVKRLFFRNFQFSFKMYQWKNKRREQNWGIFFTRTCLVKFYSCGFKVSTLYNIHKQMHGVERFRSLIAKVEASVWSSLLVVYHILAFACFLDVLVLQFASSYS